MSDQLLISAEAFDRTKAAAEKLVCGALRITSPTRDHFHKNAGKLNLQRESYRAKRLRGANRGGSTETSVQLPTPFSIANIRQQGEQPDSFGGGDSIFQLPQSSTSSALHKHFEIHPIWASANKF